MIISKNDDYILQKNKPYIKIKVQVKNRNMLSFG